LEDLGVDGKIILD